MAIPPHRVYSVSAHLSPVGTTPAPSIMRITVLSGARGRCITPLGTVNLCRGAISTVRPSKSITKRPSTTWAISHIHVAIAARKLIKHLSQSFLLSFSLLGANDPTDVIVLLIGRAAAIGFHQSPLKKRLPDKHRHFVTRSFET